MNLLELEILRLRSKFKKKSKKPYISVFEIDRRVAKVAFLFGKRTQILVDLQVLEFAYLKASKWLVFALNVEACVKKKILKFLKYTKRPRN